MCNNNCKSLFNIFTLLLLFDPLVAVSQVLNLKEICTLPAELQESSGLLSLNSGITFWTHNDGGNDPVLYEIDTLQ